MNTFRLQLRFLVPLLVTLGIAAYLALPLVDRLTLRWFSRDLVTRGELVTNALSDSISDALADPEGVRLKALFERAMRDERLVAIGLCTRDGRLLVHTDNYPKTLECKDAHEVAQQRSPVIQIRGGPVQVGAHEVVGDAGPVAELVLLHDFSFIEKRSQDTRRYLIVMIAGLGAVIALITVVVAQLSWRGWVSGARALLRGEGLIRPMAAASGELAPLAIDLRARLRDLEDAYRRSLGPEAPWNAERLRSLLRTQLRGDEVIVVSNREPYIHELAVDGSVVVRRPASGLVTAIEPVMRACSGTWIAHGSGTADRSTVDANDRLRVPPGADEYWLRRIWLTAEEEQGYYYGFANEGMWPLCHVAHVRPVFRESDWRAYREINQRFADAVVAEARSEDPIVLVQDYHFALVPAMIRAKLPAATVLTFWHIPWPNPESFGICPWRREILEGILGSTILGFHTRFHCKNFSRRRIAISRRGSSTSTRRSRSAPRRPSSRATRSRSRGRRRRPRRSGRRSSSVGPTFSLASSSPPTGVWRSASIDSTTRRASSSGCTRSNGCSKSTRNGSASSPSCRWPRRRAVRSRSTGRFASGSSGSPSGSTCASEGPAIDR
jgi:trehalose 6-phosphate synthase